MKRLLLAFQFLTIIPVKDMGPVSEKEMGDTTAVFPLVGFAEGVVLAVSASLFLKVFPAELTNALLVLMLVIMNGGLHLDGLSDTFDALGSRGDIETKLSIMKDSTVGPFGVMAIVMTLLLKYVLLNTIFFQSEVPGYLAALVALPVLSRWAMVTAAYYSKSARQDGLGRLFIEHTETRQLISATAAAIITLSLVCILSAQFSLLMFYFMFAMPVLFALSYGAVWFFKNKIDGMTGDSFGAVNEIAALLFLIMVVVNNSKLT